MTAISLDNFIADLTQQKSLYEQLLKLSMRQRDFIAGDRVDELLNLLQQRQSLIEQAGQIENRVKPIKLEWAAVSQSIDEASKQHVQNILAESRDLLGQLAQRDSDDSLVMQQKKLDVRKQIQGTQQQTQVAKHYAAGAYASSRSQINVRQ
jgi:hypothetical protein